MMSVTYIMTNNTMIYDVLKGFTLLIFHTIARLKQEAPKLGYLHVLPGIYYGRMDAVDT